MIDRSTLRALIAAEAQALIDKQRRGKHRRVVLTGDVPLAALGPQVGELADQIARSVVRGDYRMSEATPVNARIEGKLRVLYRFKLTDLLLAGALSRVVASALEATLSPHVYSYRRGRSSWQAIEALAAFVRAHSAVRPDPRTRGLYVVRRDVRAYGDVIPVDDSSLLWGELERALGPELSRWSVLQAAIRPNASVAGEPQRVLSVPTGSPLQPPMCNVYLASVDRIASAVYGGFYARFGDDMLFAHADATVAREIGAQIDAELERLRLPLNVQKSHARYFTAAGRPAPVWDEAKAATSLAYLGATVTFRGVVGLKQPAINSLLLHVDRRMDNVLRAVAAEPLDVRVGVVVDVINRTLDPRHPLSHGSSGLLQRVVNDRGQLRHLDQLIALRIATRVTGIAGVRAFRRLPYSRLRRQGLVSLLRRRDRRYTQVRTP